MKLEVLNRDGLRVFWTESKSCMPDTDVVRQLKKAGYKLKLDGKAYKEVGA